MYYLYQCLCAQNQILFVNCSIILYFFSPFYMNSMININNNHITSCQSHVYKNKVATLQVKKNFGNHLSTTKLKVNKCNVNTQEDALTLCKLHKHTNVYIFNIKYHKYGSF